MRFVSTRFEILLITTLITNFVSSDNSFKNYRSTINSENLEPDNSNYLFEDDIILTSNQRTLFGSPAGVIAPNRILWPANVLHYEFAPGEFNTSQWQTIESAISDLQKQTCVQFKRRNYLTRTYIYFRNTKVGCASPIGYQPVNSAIHLYVGGPKCQTIGTIQHELLHALGLWHEHTRADRDKFITVLWNNIEKGKEFNFHIHQKNVVEMPYDYSSVMHYKSTAFSKDKMSPTIVPLNYKAMNVIGQRVRFSRADIAKLNRLYNCPLNYYRGDDLLLKASVI